MDINFVFNPVHQDMYNSYCKTYLPKGLTVREHVLDIDSDGKFMSDGFKSIIRRKVKMIIESINDCKDDTLSIWSDADIIYNPKFSDSFIPRLESIFKYSEKHIYFQREHSYTNQVNTGFFILRKNSFTHDFFSEVLNILDQQAEIHEQDAVNKRMLPNHLVGFLPLDFGSASNASSFDFDNHYIYHCNCTHTLEDKIAMLNDVAKKIIEKAFSYSMRR